MSNQRRRIWPWVGLLGLVVLGLAIAHYVLTAKKSADAVSVVAGAVGVLAITVHLVQWLWKALRPAPPSEDSLNSVADRLAGQVNDQWTSEAGDRGLETPDAMQVRWHWSDLGVSSRPVDAVAESRRRHRFAPLPGIDPASTETIQTGELTDLLDVFGGLASGRIVIVGGPGSGKTAAAILLLLDVLKYRMEGRLPSGRKPPEVGPNERARVPVPVLFILRGWDPERQPVPDWLSRELTRQYPFLVAYGRAVTEKLISSRACPVDVDGWIV